MNTSERAQKNYKLQITHRHTHTHQTCLTLRATGTDQLARIKTHGAQCKILQQQKVSAKNCQFFLKRKVKTFKQIFQLSLSFELVLVKNPSGKLGLGDVEIEPYCEKKIVVAEMAVD